MFKPGTVFVVGAGASAELNMPLGWQLARTISNNLVVRDDGGFSRHRADQQMESLITERYRNEERDARDRIENAMSLIQAGIDHPGSIDAFIDMHADKPEVATAGKLQIALSILRAEKSSFLQLSDKRPRDGFDWNSQDLAGNWLRTFAEILVEKTRSSALDDVQKYVTVICFNYDRCIEHYLRQAFAKTYSLSWKDAQALVDTMEIIHPYGTLGNLAEPGQPAGQSVPFGADEGVDAWGMADKISTFTEEISDQTTLKRVRGAITHAKHLVFLGFSFQPQNMALLTPGTPYGSQTRPTVFASALGFSKLEIAEIQRRICAVVNEPQKHMGEHINVLTELRAGELISGIRLNLSQS